MPTSAYVVIALWTGGLLYLAGRTLNFLRLVLNNLRPGQAYHGAGFIGPLATRFTMNAAAVEPEKLNELGKRYQKKAILNHSLMFGWLLLGFVLLYVYSSSLPVAQDAPTHDQRVMQDRSTTTTASPALADIERSPAVAPKYLIGGVVCIWLLGILVLASRARSQVRLAIERRAPDANRSETHHYGFRKFARYIDPNALTAEGQALLRDASRTETLFLLWTFDGLFFVVVPLAGLWSQSH
ncbi:hypothetical protein ACVIJ6_004425 [Bradyrhizobium sp. USDA 4369]